VNQYRDLYIKAIAAMKRNVFYRPRVPNNTAILIPGDVRADGSTHTSSLRPSPRTQHLSCFAGGMVALASKAFGLPKDLEIAQNLVEGCLWAYETGPGGIMPEIMHTTICPPVDADSPDKEQDCEWDEDAWHKEVGAEHGADTEVDITKVIAQNRLPPGVTRYPDTRYILRPEAIESIFILYRITGDASLPDRAWGMFETIVKATQTKIAHAALADCTVPHPETSQTDSMESFWLAETLKYFYLIFESPEVVSLDEWVLNTEAHPLKRSK
jgi:mannosyl-oligosaccharide alpha-1,2-mannosidase